MSVAYTVALTIAFMVPLTLHIRRANPAFLYAMTGITLVILGSALVALANHSLGTTETVRVNNTLANGTLHDTYYTVSRFHYANSVGIILIFVSGLLGLQQYLQAMYLPRLTRWLFWPFVSSYFFNPIFQTFYWQGQMPRRYVDYPDYVTLGNKLQIYASMISFAAAAVLVGLFITSLIKRALYTKQT